MGEILSQGENLGCWMPPEEIIRQGGGPAAQRLQESGQNDQSGQESWES